MIHENYRSDDLPTMSLEDFPERCRRCPQLAEFVLRHEKLQAAAVSGDDDKRYTARRAMRAMRRRAFSRTGDTCPTGLVEGDCGSTQPELVRTLLAQASRADTGRN